MSTNASFTTAQASVNTEFREGARLLSEQQVGPTLMYVDVEPCDTKTLNFSFVANNPIMKVWYGERSRNQIRVYNFATAMQKYQATWQVQRVDMRYDKLSLLGKNMAAFFSDEKAAYDRIAWNKWKSASGAGPTGYDGVALFSTAHPQGGSGNQSNFSSGTNLSYSALVTAEQTAALLTKENGEPMGITFTHLEGGPKLKRRIQELTGADRIVGIDAGGAEASASVVAAATRSNVLSGYVAPIINPRETGFHWTLLDLSKPGVKPIIIQENRKPEPVILDQMTDEPRIKFDEFWYSLEGDFDANAGYWQVCYRGTGTA